METCALSVVFSFVEYSSSVFQRSQDIKNKIYTKMQKFRLIIKSLIFFLYTLICNFLFKIQISTYKKLKK